MPRMLSSASLLNPPAIGMGKLSKAGSTISRSASCGSTPGRPQEAGRAGAKTSGSSRCRLISEGQAPGSKSGRGAMIPGAITVSL